jgi:uncharacterized protein (DUF2344 family)
MNKEEILKNSINTNSSEKAQIKNAEVDWENKHRQLLGKKVKQRKNVNIRENYRRCDICLESEKYSESRLIECINCKAKCHKKCFERENKQTIHEKFGFECERCRYSELLKRDIFSIKYLNKLNI